MESKVHNGQASTATPFPFRSKSLRVALEWTSVISCISIRRETHSNGDTSVARAKSIKLLRSPDEAQLAGVIPLNLTSAPVSISLDLRVLHPTYIN
jgi:hypothetical protein